jgi:MerR family regulatory protein
MNSPSELLTIGDVSRQAGKAASSVRYYEHIGLIPAPVRISGRRRYPPAVLRTLAVTGAYLPKPAWTDIVRHTLVKSGCLERTVSWRGARW